VLGAARSHYLLLFAHPDPPRRPLFPYTTLFRSVRPESAAEAQTLARKYHDFVRSAAKGEHRNPDHAGHLHVVTPAGRRELVYARSEEHTSELQSGFDLVCRLLLEKKKQNKKEQN